MTAPIDQATREAAARRLDVSFALSAGAGSGKTAVLAARVTELLASGVPPARIAAITFTEKAAGELQRRVRDQLEARLRQAPNATLQRALDDLSDATLSTIHAFCRELLAREPLDSGWAPGTEVVAPDRSDDAAALAAVRRALRDRDAHLPRLLLRLGVDDRALGRALAAMLERRDLALHVSDAPFDWDTVRRSLQAYHDRAMDLAARCTAPDDCKLLRGTAPMRANLRRWLDAGVPGLVDALSTDRKAAGAVLRGGRKADWPGDSKDAYKSLLESWDAWRGDQLEPVHREVVTALREVAVGEVLAKRRGRAVATFDDLLFRAAALLRDDALRARLAERFDALLVDEVQDTDPIQAEVAALLARDATLTGDWRQHPPRAGKLFVVGDPKQSIYRFRRADITVWDDLEGLVERAGASGRVESLRQNFRSVPGIVRWVNHTFADMPGYVPQAPYRDDAELDPVVILDARREEAAPPEHEIDVAVRHLYALRRDGRIADATSGAMRPLRWGDVRVLVPRWAHAPAVAERLLAAGVPAIVEGGGVFFDTDEVKLSLSALRALDEPGDSEAVVHVLRGLFGFTVEELLAHLHAGGSWRYTLRDQPDTEVRRALEVLRELRDDVHETGSWIPRLDALLERTRATAVWSLLVDGPARLANLDKLRAMLRELEATSRSPTQVVERLVARARSEDEDELPLVDSDSDAVVVTSVFKAKGLEAPVVVLLDLRRKRKTYGALVDRRKGEVHLRVGPLRPPGWEAAVEREQEEEEAERRRLMYVAATRARDQLVIVRGEEDRHSLLPPLQRGLAEGEHGERVTLAPHVVVRILHGEELPEAPRQTETFPGRDDAVDAWLRSPPNQGDPIGERRAAAVAEAVRRARRRSTRWKSVGELATGRRRVDGRGTGVGRLGGVLVHRVMEQLDLHAPPPEVVQRAEALADALAPEVGLGADEVAACRDVLGRILAHPVFERARQAPEHWKEVPFAMHRGGRIVSGVIDLAFPLGEDRRRWVVVDYKSDAPPAGSAVARTYERQVALYAKALLQTVAPCEDVEAIVVGPFAELAPDDAEEALELVHEALQGTLAALLDAGAPAPVVGLDVGDPVVATLELAWPATKVGLGLDLTEEERRALEGEGWDVVAVRELEPGWLRAADEGLRRLLGLGAPPADETGDTTVEADASDEASGERTEEAG